MTLLPPPTQFAFVFAAAFLVVVMTTPLVARFAHRFGMVAQPRRDRWHSTPTPMLGGIAIAAGILLPAVVLLPLEGRMLGLLASTSIMFVVGLIDDFRHLPPHSKLAAQIGAACLLIVSGVSVDIIPYAFIAVPLTVFWVTGIINAFNLLDNMDGLSAGTAAIVSFVLFGYSVSQGDPQMAVFSLLVAGAALGFLVFNFNPARIFMGDCGSLTLGCALSGLALMGTNTAAPNLFLTLLVPVAVMALPIFDTTLVTVVRLLHGRSPAQGGRDHLSHRLVALGLSERQAVLSLYAISALSGALALASGFLDFWTAVALAAMLAISILLFGVFLAQVRVYSGVSFVRLQQLEQLNDRPVIGRVILYKRQLVEVMLDFVLVCLAYLSAYLLKFEGSFLGQFLEPFAASLPYLIPIKLMAFVVLGVYRPVWQYAGIHDVRRIAQATALGSAASFLVVLAAFQFQGFSRSVFIIDWLVLTTLMIGTRLSFAVLREGIRRLAKPAGRRVLIVGAGDTGEMVLRALLREPLGACQPVGFLDADPGKLQRTIHGIPVLGPLHLLDDVLDQRSIDQVIVAVPATTETEGIALLCNRRGIPCSDATEFLTAFLRAGLPAADRSPVAPVTG